MEKYFRTYGLRISRQRRKHYQENRKELLLLGKKRRSNRSKKERLEIAIKAKQYYLENKDMIKKHSMLYRKNWRLARTYKMTLEDYYDLVQKQKKRCIGCNKHQKEFKNLFSVDHDHKCCPGEKSCGKCIRGLLCQPCNLILGNAQDNIKTLQRLIKYLRKWNNS
jgi:hypothetical protein